MFLTRICIVLLFGGQLCAQSNGALITSYGSNGKSIFTIPGRDLRIYDAKELADNSVLLAGSIIQENKDQEDMVLIKVDKNGQPDPQFGIKFYDVGEKENVARDMAVLSDGSIILCGWYHNGNNFDILIVKLKSDGSIDMGFATGGLKIFNLGSTDTGHTVTTDKNDNIYISGRTFQSGLGVDALVIKMDKNGQLANNFGVAGITKNDFGSNETAYDMEVTDNGNIYLGVDSEMNGNTQSGAIKYLANGNPDTGFGQNGLATMATGKGFASTYGIDIQKDGKVLLVGNETPLAGNTSNITILRFNPNGSPDIGFNGTGFVFDSSLNEGSYGTDIQQTDDKGILVLGFGLHQGAPSIILQKYNESGSLDAGFGNNGTSLTDFNTNVQVSSSLLLLKDGNILIVGHNPLGSSVFLAKYKHTLSSNSVETAENKVVIYPNPCAGTFQVRSDEAFGKVTIYDFYGRFVFEKEVENGASIELPSGVYILKYRSLEEVSTHKVIVE